MEGHVHPVVTATLIAGAGYGLYVLWDVLRAVVRGEVTPEEVTRVLRGWGVDSDVYDGSCGSKDGMVWCEVCHRYHEG